eukprot:2353896-Rhodomonas_salina.1
MPCASTAQCSAALSFLAPHIASATQPNLRQNHMFIMPFAHRGYLTASVVTNVPNLGAAEPASVPKMRYILGKYRTGHSACVASRGIATRTSTPRLAPSQPVLTV